MSLEHILLSPPLAFTALLIVIIFLVLLASRLTVRSVSVEQPGTLKAYACGEDVKNHRVRPDYGQFFPFAFFFTIMHVVALIVATVPVGNLRIFGLALLFIAASGMGLFILYRN